MNHPGSLTAVRACLVVFSAFLAAAGLDGSAADEGSTTTSVSASRKFAMNIPAQPLASALQAYSGVTGIETLYDSAIAHERRSTAVVGTFTAFEALQLLLEGTRLSARSIAQDAVTIEQVQASAALAMAPPPEKSANRFYFGVIQAGLERALCDDEQVRPGRYRAVLKFSIATDGQIRHPSLVGTTGDERRDRIIARKLDGVSLGVPPPADLQQPIMIAILPQPSGAARTCARSH
ncbi:STN domain-containing protein [Bradyrhizobium embrapense]